ncbi:MAG: hypothetical protein K6T51_10385 [Rubrobacteraceae bacterium]|uniref:hypothetical protein n=1 Tax=Rubrobacter naiadicus TaxID=1392641 RepID=UPI00235F1506|nr:hypothetical protein [Rubrobacter naiadicus]MBX6762855.1 hypothetical protein [Rubrobacteraceae bacterium]MCL6439008.1 hypothetical protein [Rubrobacteraceae bacterium]
MSSESVEIMAYSPGRFPILVARFPSGELRTLYFETGYDPGLSKRVSEEWLIENAIGRHSFVGLNPPDEVSISGLGGYAERLRASSEDTER